LFRFVARRSQIYVAPAGLSVKNPKFRLFYLLQRLSEQNVTYNSGKKRKYFQKGWESSIFRKKRRFGGFFFWFYRRER